MQWPIIEFFKQKTMSPPLKIGKFKICYSTLGTLYEKNTVLKACPSKLIEKITINQQNSHLKVRQYIVANFEKL
jgi:hypothetical protein